MVSIFIMVSQIADVAHSSDLEKANAGPTATSDMPADPDMKEDIKLEQDTLMTREDAFGDEEFAEVKYKVLKWWFVLILPCLIGIYRY